MGSKTKCHTRILLGVATAALLAAAPAQAMPSDGASPESSCPLKTQLGTQYHQHGTTITVVDADGKEKKWRCNNGTWEVQKIVRPTASRGYGFR